MDKKMSIPVSAMQFRNTGSKIGSQLDMVVYSGGVVKNHFFWQNLAIDLKGIKFPKAKYPILENHDTSRKIGWCSRSEISVNGGLKIRGGEILSTPAGQEFKRLSEAAFPLESSMYIPPTKIERIREGEEAKVNGVTLKGPGTIFKESVFREASVVVFGQDSNTKATALSENHLSLNVAIEGKFDPDEQLAQRIFSLSQGGGKSDSLDVSDEDAKLAEEIFELAGGRGGAGPEKLSAEDEEIAQRIFEAGRG